MTIYRVSSYLTGQRLCVVGSFSEACKVAYNYLRVKNVKCLISKLTYYA